jgi:hypothetical protein
MPTRHRNVRRSRSRTPARPSVAAVTRNAGNAKPRIAPTALNGRGGAAKISTGIQVTQKITNASTRYDITGYDERHHIGLKPPRVPTATGWAAVMRPPSAVEEQ